VEDFLSVKTPRRGVRPNQDPSEWVPGALPQRVNQTERKGNHSHPFENQELEINLIIPELSIR
jgi:hypothetical protein